MSRADRLLLLALAAALLLMAGLVLSPSGPGGSGASADSPFPGEPRNLAVDALRRKLLSGELSDREALFWHEEK